MDRRHFLKTGAGLGAAALIGCAPKNKEGIALTEKELGPVPTDKMTYRIQPKDKSKVSLLGYGCMRLPRKPKENGDGDEIDQEMVNQLTDYALAHGVTYFDTAPVYCQGLSERSMGIALSRHPRESYQIATKNSSIRGGAPTTLKALKDMYYKSMSELQVDYLDYYLLHSIGNFEDYKKRFLDTGMLDFLLKEREAGRIRNLGWSFHGQTSFFKYMLEESGVKWDFCQIQMNYYDWIKPLGAEATAQYLYEKLTEHKVPVVIMEPLLGGRLAKVPGRIEHLMKAREPKKSVASWAFRFVGGFSNVLTVLSGMTYMEHLQDNIRSFSPLSPLSEEDHLMLKEAVSIMDSYPSVNCTGCNYCMPCPYGLDIPGIFAHYNKCLDEGRFPDNPQSATYKKDRRAFLIGYDRSVPRMRQASHCIACGECVKACPQRIRIPGQMHRIDQFVEEIKTADI